MSKVPPLVTAGLLLVLSSNLPCQAALTQLTSSARAHMDALISPDGASVAFRVGGTELGVVGVRSGVESILYQNSTGSVDEFLWDPTSSSLYFVDGSTIRIIARSGGNPRVVGTVSGSNVALWDIDSSGSLLFGTRFDSSTQRSYIFNLPTAGGTGPQDILSAQAVIDEVQVDSSDSYLLYRSWNGSPFTPVTYNRANLDGTGATPMWTSNGNDNAQGACWLDAGQHIALMRITASLPAGWHVGRVDLAGSLEMLTELSFSNRRPHAAPGGQWIACESRSPDGQGFTVGLLPTVGGGLVLLGGGQQLAFNPGSVLTRGLSIDDSETMVAVSAGTSPSDPQPQIWVADVDDEVRIQPRLELGQPFSIEMNVAAGELGAVAASFGLASTPLSVPGISGSLALLSGPGNLATVLTGLGTGGPISASYTVPNDPNLAGFRLFFQGLRLNTLGGSLTRYGYYQVF